MEEVFSAEAVIVVVLLLLAVGGTVLAAGRLRMPTAVGLVLAGLVLGALARIANLSWLAEFELTPGVIRFVFLPTLLFESAFNIDARRLGENLLPVFILAVTHLRAHHGELVSWVLDGHKGEIVVDLLRGVPFSEMLDDGEIVQLARRFGWQRYPAGKVVFLQGDYGSEVHVIRRDPARVTVATEGTKRQDRLLEEGSFFGELALMGYSVRHASVRATRIWKCRRSRRTSSTSCWEACRGWRRGSPRCSHTTCNRVGVVTGKNPAPISSWGT